jgi:ankyrin repeat protein
MLLSTGRADTEQHTALGDSPLDLACAHGHTNCVDLLLLAGARAEPQALFKACAHGQQAVISRLLATDAGLHLGLMDSSVTCLMMAAAGGHAGMVTALLQAGMVIGSVKGANEVALSVDDEGNSVLHHAAACERGEEEAGAVCEALLQGGGTCTQQAAMAAHALLCCTNKAGETPLGLACKHGREQAARVMLRAAPECEHVRNALTQETPLAVASRAGHNKVVRVLLRAGGVYH